MKKLTAISALFCMFLTSSCRKDSITGGGSSVNKEITLANFSSIQGNADIKLHITHGSVLKTEIRGYENLVNITETAVINGKLIINYKREYHNVQNSNVELYIVMPVLNYVGTNGSGDAWIDGFQNGNFLESKINGSSNIYISNSQYNNVLLEINGSGDIRAAGLSTDRAEANIHGSGDIEISCTQYLKASTYGSGDIKYWGNPVVDAQVTGSGRITRQ